MNGLLHLPIGRGDLGGSDQPFRTAFLLVPPPRRTRVLLLSPLPTSQTAVVRRRDALLCPKTARPWTRPSGRLSAARGPEWGTGRCVIRALRTSVQPRSGPSRAPFTDGRQLPGALPIYSGATPAFPLPPGSPFKFGASGERAQRDFGLAQRDFELAQRDFELAQRSGLWICPSAHEIGPFFLLVVNSRRGPGEKDASGRRGIRGP